jgi:hypothetical protein
MANDPTAAAIIAKTKAVSGLTSIQALPTSSSASAAAAPAVAAPAASGAAAASSGNLFNSASSLANPAISYLTSHSQQAQSKALNDANIAAQTQNAKTAADAQVQSSLNYRNASAQNQPGYSYNTNSAPGSTSGQTYINPNAALQTSELNRKIELSKVNFEKSQLPPTASPETIKYYNDQATFINQRYDLAAANIQGPAPTYTPAPTTLAGQPSLNLKNLGSTQYPPVFPKGYVPSPPELDGIPVGPIPGSDAASKANLDAIFSANNKTMQDANAALDAQNATQRAADKASMLKGGGALAGSAAAGFGLFSSIEGMAENGASSSGILGAAGSLVGLAVGLHTLGSALAVGTAWTSFGGAIAGLPIIGPFLAQGLLFLTTPWGIAIVAAAVVVTAILMALLGKKPNAEEQAVIDLSDQLSVWDTSVKPLILSAAAASALVTMGYGIDKPLTMIGAAGISVPTVQLNAKFLNALSNADGSAFQGGAIPTNTPLIIKGAGKGGEDKVLLISNGAVKDGVAMTQVKTYDLSKNMAFTTPTNSQHLYVPFFVNGKPNPEAVTAVATQTSLLNSANQLSGASAQSAAHIAGSADKQGVNVTPLQ